MVEVPAKGGGEHPCYVPSMPRTARPALLLALVVALTTIIATPANAAERRVPFGFFGTTLTSELAIASVVPDAALDQQMGLMASSGVESVRIVLSWNQFEPRPGAYNFASLDRLVAASARHGISFFPNISASPRWASSRPLQPEAWRYGPKDPNTYAAFMRQLVLRYGPRGTFWAQNPGVPRVPIRQWQIWNEPSASWFWGNLPFARSYTRLLKASYRAIHRADPKAKVYPGGFVGTGAGTPWDNIRDLYKAGAKGYFDGVAVHPFTLVPNSVKRTVDQTFDVIKLVRLEMRKRGRREQRKPIILTELTWPAAVGAVPNNVLVGLETTPRGQADRLRLVYRRLARERRFWGVTQAYCFSWATDYVPVSVRTGNETFRFSGLMKFTRGTFTPMPILQTYASVAARFQGCRKTIDARRCR
jgi:hypothetical protein